MPNRVHPVFYVDLLRPLAKDPLPSQQVDKDAIKPIIINGKKEYVVKRILEERKKGRYKKIIVKWLDYSEPTEEYLEEIRHTEAWKHYKRIKMGEGKGVI